MKKIHTTTLTLLSLVGSLSLAAAQPAAASLTSRDVAVQGQTADEQSQSKPDLELARKIRAAIVKDKQLSMSAHNCKVITQSGKVRLRGEVASTDEKGRVEAIAVKIAGEGKVTNELTVKATSQTSQEQE
jgi:osmotically-inducible protein OsmY